LRSIIGFSIGGVALAVGAVTGIVSLSKVSDLKTRCPNDVCSMSDRDKLSSAITLGNVSNIALPIGVIGLAWGVYELISLPSSPTKPRASSGLRLELTGTGAAIHGAL
jgi:hypothetical protein